MRVRQTVGAVDWLSKMGPRTVAVPSLSVILSFVVLLSLCGTGGAQNQATCDGLDSMIQRTTLLTCSKNPTCDMVSCTSSNPLLSGVFLSMTLLSCRTPPGVQVLVLKNNAIAYEGVIDQTMVDIDVGSGATLTVTLDQLEDQQAIGIGIVVNTFIGSSDVIPYSVIPLDTQSCITPSSTIPSEYFIPSSSDRRTTSDTDPITSSASLPSTQRPTPTPYSTPVVEDKNTTCSVLKELAAEAQGFKCTADTIEPCDRVDCVQEVFGMEYSAVIVLLPCTTPASLTIVMSEGEKVLVDETISQSKNITVEDLFDLMLVITLDHFKDAIGLQVDIIFFGGGTERIIKYSVIPLEKSKHCDDSVVTASPSRGLTITPSIILPLIIALTVSIQCFSM